MGTGSSILVQPEEKIMKRIRSIRLFWLATTVFALATGFFLTGHPLRAAESSVPAAASRGPVDPVEFANAVDAFFTREMKARHIPGAVFILVKDGKVFFSKGYGYASLESRKPVDPETTCFKAGSISKVFTATAVTQLAQRGAVRMDADVNRYLKSLQVPGTFARPITLDALLTHSAGFAEYIFGQHVLDPSQIKPLGRYLARRLPPRIQEPGEVFSYNDHGMSLAGLVVEEVSGLPFEEYQDRNILKPLGMTRSTFLQPVPAAWGPDMARGYRYQGGRYVPEPPDYCLTVPAACLVSTGSDMAKFMIAQLQKGALGDARILEPAWAEEMQRRHFGCHPRLRGRAWGFAESIQNDRRALFHDGGMPGILSRMYLLPEENWGFFVSYNCFDIGFKSELTTFLLDRYCPADQDFSALKPYPGAEKDLSRFAGYYREVEGLTPFLLKMKYLGDQVPVTASGDGLRIFGQRFVEVEPLYFRAPEDGGRVAFRLGKDGEVRYLFVGSGAFEKVRWYETPPVQYTVLGFFSVVFLSFVLVWPVRKLFRKFRPANGTPRALRRGRFLAFVYSLSSLASVVGIYLYFQMVQEDYFIFMRGQAFWLKVCLVLNLINVPLAVLALAHTLTGWRRRGVSVAERVHFTLFALAVLACTAFLHYWNLLGFKY